MEGDITGLLEVTVQGSRLMEINASREAFGFARNVIGSTRIRNIFNNLSVIVLRRIMTPSYFSLDVFFLLFNIHHSWSTQKIFWEEKSTPVNMTSCGRQNVRKHREIKNCEQYIILDISFKLNFLYKREFTYSELIYYMGRTDKGLITSLDLRTKISNKKKNKVFHYWHY